VIQRFRFALTVFRFVCLFCPGSGASNDKLNTGPSASDGCDGRESSFRSFFKMIARLRGDIAGSLSFLFEETFFFGDARLALLLFDAVFILFAIVSRIIL